MRYSYTLLAITGTLLLASDVRAGAVPQPGVGIHISPVVPAGNACAPPPGVTDPYHFRFHEPTLSTPEGPFYFVYVLGCNYLELGLGGIEFGINYPGGYNPAGGIQPICVFDWTLCAEFEFPVSGWPAPGGGNLIVWTTPNCGPDVMPEWFIFYKVAGYFYLGAYSSAQFSITERPTSGFLKVTDCNGFETDLTHDGYARGVAGFGNTGWAWPGCYSQGLPVQPTTWSGIKTLNR